MVASNICQALPLDKVPPRRVHPRRQRLVEERSLRAIAPRHQAAVGPQAAALLTGLCRRRAQQHHAHLRVRHGRAPQRQGLTNIARLVIQRIVNPRFLFECRFMTWRVTIWQAMPEADLLGLELRLPRVYRAEAPGHRVTVI